MKHRASNNRNLLQGSAFILLFIAAGLFASLWYLFQIPAVLKPIIPALQVAALPRPDASIRQTPTDKPAMPAKAQPNSEKLATLWQTLSNELRMPKQKLYQQQRQYALPYPLSFVALNIKTQIGKQQQDRVWLQIPALAHNLDNELFGLGRIQWGGLSGVIQAQSPAQQGWHWQINTQALRFASLRHGWFNMDTSIAQGTLDTKRQLTSLQWQTGAIKIQDSTGNNWQWQALHLQLQRHETQDYQLHIQFEHLISPFTAQWSALNPIFQLQLQLSPFNFSALTIENGIQNLTWLLKQTKLLNLEMQATVPEGEITLQLEVRWEARWKAENQESWEKLIHSLSKPFSGSLNGLSALQGKLHIQVSTDVLQALLHNRFPEESLIEQQLDWLQTQGYLQDSGEHYVLNFSLEQGQFQLNGQSLGSGQQYQDFLQRQQINRTLSRLSGLQVPLEAYYAHTGTFPDKLAVLNNHIITHDLSGFQIEPSQQRISLPLPDSRQRVFLRFDSQQQRWFCQIKSRLNKILPRWCRQ